MNKLTAKKLNGFAHRLKKEGAVPRFDFVQVKISKAQAQRDRLREVECLINQIVSLLSCPFPKTKGVYKEVKKRKNGRPNKAYKDAAYEESWGAGTGPVFPLICSNEVANRLMKKMNKKK